MRRSEAKKWGFRLVMFLSHTAMPPVNAGRRLLIMSEGQLDDVETTWTWMPESVEIVSIWLSLAK